MIKVIKSAHEMHSFSRKLIERGQVIAFVPTMGFLHEGHLALIEAAKKKADMVVISIFVNPIQFAPGEDFEKYPRDLSRDKKLLKNFAPLVIFTPKEQDLFNPDFKTSVKVGELGERLCGRSRPGHFNGVTTIVAKLFNIVMPDIVLLGEKDYQQCKIIEQMVKDLNYSIKVQTVPTVREYDGLALSSRNVFLKENERKSAAVIYKALNRAKKMIEDGERDARKIHLMISRQIGMEPSVRVDYIAMVDPETLKDSKDIKGPLLIAVAARIGKTRLIDNVLVTP